MSRQVRSVRCFPCIRSKKERVISKEGLIDITPLDKAKHAHKSEDLIIVVKFCSSKDYIKRGVLKGVNVLKAII